jgi:putative ABC transport system permease protein
MESFFQDLKHSVRTFLKRPGFTGAAIAALTLGIGTNTAIFSIVDAVLLKPLHAPEAERIVVFMSTSGEGSSSNASEIKFNLWRQQTSVFQDVSAYYPSSVNLTDVDQPQRASALSVTGDYFHLFGLSVVQGRIFAPEEEKPHGPNAAILSNEFWKRAFGGSSQIIGKSISLSGARYEVIGIMAPGVQTETPEAVDVWLPFPIDPNSDFQAHYFEAFGRLKTGVKLSSANARLLLTTTEFRLKFPSSLSTSRGDVFSVQPIQQILVKGARSSLLILTGSVFFVLLIACANVANLLMVRATGRTTEIAIRVAMGASRIRIIRQLLTESVLLALAGGVFGLILGMVAIRGLLSLNAAQIPRIGMNGANVTMDWRILAFTVILCLLTTVLFGLIPALKASRTDINSTLKEGSGRTGTGFQRNRTRSLLVVSEISLAFLLLIGAALLIRTFVALRSVNPGFVPRNVVTTQTLLDPRAAGKSGVNEILEDVNRRLNSVPGVKGVGYTKFLPLGGDFNSLPIIVVGRPLNGPSHGSCRWMVVSSSYFDVLEIPLLHGRSFTDADRLGSPGVAIVNQTMARQLWPNSDPLNALVSIGNGLGPNFAEPARQIVGVVGDVHDNGLGEPSQPTVFVPGAQLSNDRTAGKTVAWVIRTSGQSNSAILRELREATREPVSPLRTMDEVISQSTARQALNMLLMSIFGGSALLLAAIGIYGLMAYMVQLRTQEIGVRMALGARSSDVRNMLAFQGMRLAFLGIAIGMVAAFGLTRFLASFLFAVETLDPIVFILVPIALGVVAFVAVWVPASRATRVDPTAALRYG